MSIKKLHRLANGAVNVQAIWDVLVLAHHDIHSEKRTLADIDLINENSGRIEQAYTRL